MSNTIENKAFIIKYFNALSGKEKSPALCDQYMTDDKLKEHIIFFDGIFPGYEIYGDELTAEGDKVVVRARVIGIHQGEFNGIPPTNKRVEFPFVVSYTIKNGKIVDHWMIADQMILMEQLGVVQTANAEM